MILVLNLNFFRKAIQLQPGTPSKEIDLYSSKRKNSNYYIYLLYKLKIKLLKTGIVVINLKND